MHLLCLELGEREKIHVRGSDCHVNLMPTKEDDWDAGATETHCDAPVPCSIL